MTMLLGIIGILLVGIVILLSTMRYISVLDKRRETKIAHEQAMRAAEEHVWKESNTNLFVQGDPVTMETTMEKKRRRRRRQKAKGSGGVQSVTKQKGSQNSPQRTTKPKGGGNPKSPRR